MAHWSQRDQSLEESSLLTVPWLNTEVTWVVDSDMDPSDLWTSFGGGWRFILGLLVPDEGGLAGGGNVSMMIARNVSNWMELILSLRCAQLRRVLI